MLRFSLLFLLGVLVVTLAVSGVFNPIIDATITTNGTVGYSKTIFVHPNDSTHVLFLTSDSLKAYIQLQAQKYPNASWTDWTGVDSIGVGAGVTVKAWKNLTSSFYGYRIKYTVATLDVTSSRVRLQAWETGD